jgi:multisubunit Na+/H+ antiporter MnhB subunit
MNSGALTAVVAFAVALLLVFGLLYRMAAKSHARGELDSEGIDILRWALAGQLAIFAVLAVTAFLT